MLLLKTSSLGDLLHTLPALTDAVKHLQTLRIDWLAEEAFCQIPQWHPAVHRVIPISLRRWRKHPLQAVGSGEIAAFVRDLRSHSYDAIIDAQGLLKSALPGLLGKGPCYGYDRFSAREPLSALAYTHKVSVARNLHAIERVRRLFAASLGYNAPATQADFGLPGGHRYRQHPYLVFLHGSSWPSKRWPQPCWRLLAEMALAQGFRVLLPWGNEAEQARARELARGQDGVEVLPRMDLNALRDLLSASSGVLGVDSGLVHLAAALSVPTLALYGPTSADLTGTQGRLQKNLQAAYH
ncbi:MAG: lipopolysaccharide heptosyltransferase I, partial [gamma proteobacterium symbiont of Bathyaustriella thionipta]|nr:lipopolysaccharide heptosyltransferase I [gamma proteobacterium symbiont of Bathyaustriella thionipta]